MHPNQILEYQRIYFDDLKKTNMKFNKQWNDRVPSRNDKETNNQPSMTVPDQNMSVREIMQRHAKGLPTGGQKVPFYDEDSDLPDPKTLDLSEIQEFRDEYREKVDSINDKKKSAEQKKAEKMRLDEIDAEIKKREAAKAGEQSTNTP